jgi:hypothetical protein
MKKYLQYNTSHYREAPTGIGVHLPKRQTIDTCQNEARVPNILDLSGRPNIHHGMKATEQKEAKEQEAALDLSKYGRQEVSSFLFSFNKLEYMILLILTIWKCLFTLTMLNILNGLARIRYLKWTCPD